jgi:hypothetical protein
MLDQTVLIFSGLFNTGTECTNPNEKFSNLEKQESKHRAWEGAYSYQLMIAQGHHPVFTKRKTNWLTDFS